MLEEKTDALVVLCTVPDAEAAGRLARGLVERRLAACVNVVPGLRSIYRWQGEIHDEGELLLIVKSSRARLGELAAWLEQEHPYEVPEILALPVEAGARAYLGWLGEQLTP